MNHGGSRGIILFVSFGIKLDIMFKKTSIQVGLSLGVKLVGSDMTWDKFRDVNNSSISRPSLFVSPSGHQNCECPLKSPAKKVAYGFSIMICEWRFLKLDRKSANSADPHLEAGLRYNTAQILIQQLLIRQKTGHDGG